MDHETLSATGPTRPRKRPPLVRIGLVGLFVLLVASLGVTGIVAGIFPGSNAVLAPLLCPSDTTRALVVKEVHHSGGKTSTTASLVCQAPSGRLARLNGAVTFFGMFGVVAAVLGTLAALRIAVALIMRRTP